ncbi:carboxypeptidase-like regulatory domain-containing protein [Arthrobacter sp. M4]|uniref:carboxypeptidase-like regulatory domain-containing protein n=1 Tax=Arthrobacter sp. M4 TaxID=218160 RepID=UPI001CDC85D2|nr:carboxypeptidase-like regulatory domain-containing protein [Arthrobacter sp. M4]MCA4133051.1 carboxypeptidase-like regulatory domain-containing protein [Arthrobacter sp. M4]
MDCVEAQTSPAANGTYSFTGLPGGNYNVNFDGQNQINVLPEYAYGTLTEGQASVANTTMSVGAIVSGKVSIPAGEIATNVSIAVGYGNQGAKVKADGTFRVLGVSEGRTTVSFSSDKIPHTFYPGVPDIPSAQRVFPVLGQETNLPVTVPLVLGGFIKGSVTAPAQASTYQLFAATTRWSDAADYNVDARYNSGPPLGSDGTYTSGPLWPGDYRVRFSGSGASSDLTPISFAAKWYSNSSTPSQATKVTVQSGQTVSNISASLSIGGSIKGKLLNLEGQQPSYSTEIQVLDSQGFAVASTGPYGGSTGQFELSGLAAGTYRVAFNRGSGYALEEAQFYQGQHESAGLASGAAVSVTAGQATNLADSQLTLGGSFSGQVNGPDGQPLQDAAVHAYTEDGSLVTRSARTGPDGRFTIGGLTTGQYKLKVNADGRIPDIGFLYSGNTKDSATAALVSATAGATKDVGILSYAPAPTPGIPGGSVPITPTRFLDTRSLSGPVAAGGSISFKAAGVNGIPSDASAVVVNLTVTETKAAGFLTAYASGSVKPNASNVNYGPGQTVPNLAVVPVGPDGKVTISNTSSGSAQVIADISAYFKGGTPTAPGAFVATAPSRFLDTRGSTGPVAAGGNVSFQAGGVNGIPANASAVVVNLTVTETKAAGFLTAYASGSAKPNASNVNYGPAQTVPNLAVVPVGPDGKVTISNTSSGTAQVIADVSGYFLPGDPVDSGAFGKITPTRFLDTRSTSPVISGGAVSFQAAGLNGVPANAAGIWVNLTVTQSNSFGYLTGYASGAAKPNSSNVNYAAGQTVPNLAYLPIGSDGKVTIANTESGTYSTVHIIADVSGYTLK